MTTNKEKQNQSTLLEQQGKKISPRTQTVSSEMINATANASCLQMWIIFPI